MSVEIKKSTNPNKKMMAVFYNSDGKKIKTIHFGAAGMSDYTQHKNEERKSRYIARHSANESFNQPMTAGALSRWILWNMTSLRSSIADYKRKFGFKTYKPKPTKTKGYERALNEDKVNPKYPAKKEVETEKKIISLSS